MVSVVNTHHVSPRIEIASIGSKNIIPFGGTKSYFAFMNSFLRKSEFSPPEVFFPSFHSF